MPRRYHRLAGNGMELTVYLTQRAMKMYTNNYSCDNFNGKDFKVYNGLPRSVLC